MNLCRLLGTAAAAALLVTSLAGCGDDTVARPEDPAAVDELAQHDGEPCPDALQQSTADDPGESPGFAADEAWVCRYDPGDGEAAMRWTRAGEPVPVGAERLADLLTSLEDLEPVSTDGRMCTMDLGPRYLLVLSDAGDLTGIAVDDFGCRDVRVTDEPFDATPGEGGIPGLFGGPASLAEDLRALYGS